jgi:hypothetical protein
VIPWIVLATVMNIVSSIKYFVSNESSTAQITRLGLSRRPVFRRGGSLGLWTQRLSLSMDSSAELWPSLGRVGGATQDLRHARPQVLLRRIFRLWGVCVRLALHG